jgi:hypothetical protein
MKMLFAFLFFPMISMGQTIHIKNDTIVYEGKEKIPSLTPSEILKRSQDALASIVSNYKNLQTSDHSVTGRGQFKLQTPYDIKRTVSYTIQITTTDEGYDFLIDSVSLKEQVRGEKSVTKSSAELLDTMGEAGKIVDNTEKILNEMDMNFQKLLAQLKSKLSAAVDQN